MVKSPSKLDLKWLSCATLAIGGQLCPLTSEAVVFKILAISTQMHLNDEVAIKIGLQMPELCHPGLWRPNCPLKSEAVVFKVLDISTQMHLNGEVAIKIGPQMAELCYPGLWRPTLSSGL